MMKYNKFKVLILAITLLIGVMLPIHSISAIQINDHETYDATYLYYAKVDTYTERLLIYAPDLALPPEEGYVDYTLFLNRWYLSYTGIDNRLLIITYDRMYITYEDDRDVDHPYTGFTDTMLVTVDEDQYYNIQLLDRSINKFIMTIPSFVFNTNPFITITTQSQMDYGDIYDIGYDEGYYDGRSSGYDDWYESRYQDGYDTGRADYGAYFPPGSPDGFDGWYGFQDGLDYGRELGFIDGVKVDYEEAYDKGYDKGFEKGQQSDFTANLETWIVPAIILVLIGGGLISFAKYRGSKNE